MGLYDVIVFGVIFIWTTLYWEGKLMGGMNVVKALNNILMQILQTTVRQCLM